MNEVIYNSKAIQQSLGQSNKEIYSTAYALLSQISSDGSLLDFGSGRGHLLELIKDLQFEKLSGADLMSRPSHLNSSCCWIQSDLNTQLPCEDESFDVIVAIEVIEHLENPRAVVRELRRLLKPNGYLLLSTPNNESIRSLLSLVVRGHFVSFLDKDYPAHITALTALDLNRILLENAFSQLKFSYTKKGMIPGMKGLTWQQVSFGLFHGKRFSDNVFVMARKI